MSRRNDRKLSEKHYMSENSSHISLVHKKFEKSHKEFKQKINDMRSYQTFHLKLKDKSFHIILVN